MSQNFDKKKITKNNLKTPKEIIWENEEKNISNVYFIKKFLFIFTFLILNILRFILYPICDFKIGILYSNKIGRLLANTEYYLRKKSLTEKKKYQFHILISGKPVNSQILKMISRKTLLIHNVLIYNFISEVKRRTFGSDLWVDLNITGWLRGNVWTNSQPQLSFSKQEEEKGKQILEKLGLTKNDKFVCIFAKDKFYSDDPENPPLPGSFWATKDFRNCNIENFIKAAEFLAEKNIYVIRIGAHKPDQILQSANNKIIDYTGTIRKNLDDPEFADAYIPANCEFFIGCTSGIHHFASIFNKPIASTNLIPYGECGRNLEDIFIFKKCININTNEILSISEAINFGITGDWLSKEQILDLESRGIFFQENSPDEILDLTREMYERLNGLWNEKNDEKELMENFLKISNIYDSEGQKFPGRVCYNFLKKNKKFCEIFN
ncbi:TIGR04372 family glycosyltransferase [Candidatus Pelagibacter sp.]|nr:TIGR04372 family glycosyltransferase [Candidatus Pelagibacter sp.]